MAVAGNATPRNPAFLFIIMHTLGVIMRLLLIVRCCAKLYTMNKFMRWAVLPTMLFGLFAIYSCSSDDDDSGQKNVTMKVGDTYTIKSGSDWSVDNDYVAEITGSTIKATLVGEATVSNGTNSFKLTVDPKTILWDDPYMKWNASKAQVKSAMSKYELMNENDDQLIYYGKNKADYYGYNFQNGKLSTSMVLTSYLEDEFVDFIKERYILIDSNDETQIIYFTDYSMKYVVIAMFIDIDGVPYCVVGYGDASDTNSMAKTMKSEFVNLKPFIAERIKNGDINVANSNIREVKANIIETMKR